MSSVRKFGKDVEKTRTIPFVFSDETRDTYGTVFTASGWVLDRFDKNGIALFNHNAYSSDPNMAIGSARAWVEGKKLLGEITFETKDINPLAETVFRKFLAGTYKGVSIRYIPIENGKWGEGSEALEGKNPTYYIGKRELVEISVVPIPSNKNALVRSYEAETSTELEEGEAYFSYGEVRSCSEPEDIPDDETDDSDKSDDSRNDTASDDTYIRTMLAGYEAICKF